MMIKKIFLAFFVLVFLFACAHVTSSGSKEINYRQYNKLLKGKTTLKEAVRLLGNPSETQESETKLIAVWETSETTIDGLLVPFGSKVEMKKITTSLFFDRETKILVDHYQRTQRSVNGDKMNLF
jgi:hypothetical protein